MPSSRNATATLIVRPNAASAAIHPNRVPTTGPSTTGAGQTGNSAMVSANASTIRLAAGPAETPGIGTNAIAPAMRARTSRNPYNSEKFRRSSTCIAAKIAEQNGGERNQLGCHPGQQQQQAEQECG